MVERQDIDALLISALYGELTPAEEKSLAAHLESHPADRTALDDLTRAREVLHQSRILAFQYEPPQSVSALLMQEASRRAPKKASEGEGWFARFVRSFVQHPAMAAAAMIVVVVGAASLVSRNSDKQFADTPTVETTKNTETAPAVALETPVDRPTAAPAPATGFGGNTDQYRVALADGENEAKNQDKYKAQVEDKKDEGGKPALPESDPNAAFYDASNRKGGDSLASKTKPDRGLELRRQDAMPKDLDAAKPEPKPAPAEEKLAKQAQEAAAQKANKISTERQVVATDDAIGGSREQGYVTDGRAGASGGGVAPGAAAPTTAPATTAQAPRNAGPRAPASPPPPAKNAPRQEIATDTATASRDGQKSKEKVVNDPNLAWAKDQHAALVTAVRANNCGRAASIALSIANRTPAYYAQNVETDRSVKECIAYINTEREKDAEVRASRAKKSQLKNAEPAAPKRAADQPSKATSTDSSR